MPCDVGPDLRVEQDHRVAAAEVRLALDDLQEPVDPTGESLGQQEETAQSHEMTPSSVAEGWHEGS